MRYEVQVGGRRIRIETEPQSAGPSARMLVEGRAVAYEVRDIVAGRQWSVVVEGRAHEVALVGGDPFTLPGGPATLPGGPARMLVDGVELAVTVTDERALAARRARAHATVGRHEVRAPMPGLLKAVHVREGDVVERNAALATLEAMKMENELRAPARAKVQRLAAAPGAKVESGSLIAVLVEEA